MSATVYRRVALALLVPLVAASKPARAGLVGDLGHRPGLAEFDAFALPEPGEDPFVSDDAWEPDSYAAQTIFGDGAIPDVFAITSRKRFDLKELSGPFTPYGSGSSISDILTDAPPVSEFGFAAGRNSFTAKPGRSGSTRERGDPLDPFDAGEAPSILIPEPTVLLLLAAGIPAIIGRRHRHRP